MRASSGSKLRVGVVGATGLAGQQFLAALGTHPRLEVTAVAASSRTAGKAYRDALRHASGQVGWYAAGQLDERIAGLVVQDAESFDARTVDLVFTAIDAGPARELEPRYAQHTPVISTASAFRREADVPLIVPGVNLAHAALLDVQRQRRGWKGFVAPNPNCTTVGLAVTLAPLAQRFGVEHVDMVSLQAVSGAGRSPGVIALDVVDNVIPFIPSEEEKVQWETQKILGTLRDDGIAPAQFGISATCTRIAVLEGHTEVVHVRLAQPADEAGIRAAWASLGADIAGKYPSAPREFITVHDDPFRPQVRLDRDAGDGMVTSVGRLRRDETVDNGWKYVLVSHNTKMGAARGCILLAEYLIERGYIA